MLLKNKLTIISNRNYFDNMLDIISNQKRMYNFIKFVNNYNIEFNFYGFVYNINLLCKSYESKIKKSIEEFKNYKLDLFYNENESIIRIHQDILKHEEFEMGCFFSSILMSAVGKNQKYKDMIEKIKHGIYNGKVVHCWIKKNQSTLHQQIINDCHKK